MELLQAVRTKLVDVHNTITRCLHRRRQREMNLEE
jgi:hypothetical protein